MFTYALLQALGDADLNGDGMIDVLELASFVDKQVPILSFDAWKMRQIPQMRIVGSNFPLVFKTTLLPAVGESPSSNIPVKPTHVVTGLVSVRQSAHDTAPRVVELGAGSQVYLVESSDGWALIAREGRKLGYVDAKSLVALQ